MLKARKETDKILTELEKEIDNQYDEMGQEILSKYEVQLLRFNDRTLTAKDKKKLKQITAGITAIIIKYNKKIIDLINKKTKNVYNINKDYAIKRIEELLEEHVADISNMIDNDYMTELFYEEQTNATVINSKFEKTIAGIIVGGVGVKILKDTIKKIKNKQKNGMRITATNEVTRKENLAIQVVGFKYKDNDRSIKKKWITMHDNRVRASHRALDGETVDVDKPFSNGLMYPGDGSGSPSDYINCRCRLDFVRGGE